MTLHPKTTQAVTNSVNVSIVTVAVPYRMPGNVVSHIRVTFEVSTNNHLVKAVPLYSLADKNLTNLPASIDFQSSNGKIIIGKNQYLEMAKEIVEAIHNPA